LSLRDSNVDYKFLEAMGIRYKWYQPWQLGLWIEEFSGKFMWYPEKGTLMVDYGEYNNKNLGRFTDTEEVCIKMREVVENILCQKQQT